MNLKIYAKLQADLLKYICRTVNTIQGSRIMNNWAFSLNGEDFFAVEVIVSSW